MAKVTLEAGDIDYGNGICVACGNVQEGCEPDAREYECEECGKPKVYGVEEAILQGLVELGEGAEGSFGNLL